MVIRLIIITLGALLCVPLMRGKVIVPNDRKPEVWVNEGDVTLGYLSQVHGRGSGDSLCSSTTIYQFALHMVEAVAMAVRDVNRRDDILPNVTLGFVAVDVCHSGQVALARSSYFLKDTTMYTDANCRLPKNQTTAQLDEYEFLKNQRHFDVQGVIGPMYSHQAVKVASLFSAFQMPIISESSTSDELSDKRNYEYFLRVTPPDQFVAACIVDIITHFNWTYVILIYSEGTYSESLAKVTEKLLKHTEVCIAFSHIILSTADEQDYELLANKIYQNRKARVIIDYVAGIHGGFYIVMKQLEKKGVKNHFLFLSDESYYGAMKSPMAEYISGAIFLRANEKPLTKFIDYYKGRRPWQSPKNPWLADLWETGFKCSWDNDTESNASCYQHEEMAQMEGYSEPNTNYIMSRVYDAVHVFAQAIHGILSDKCPEKFLRPAEPKSCINGPLLLKYLRQTDMEGINGRITFDSSGDFLAKYNVYQIRKTAKNSTEFDNFIIGEYDMLAATRLSIVDGAIDWNAIPLHVDVPSSNEPFESVCSQACAPKHIYKPGELPCCWQCEKCRSNEILANNLTLCQPCPNYSWPDEKHAIKCTDTEQTYLKWNSALGACLMVFGAIGAGSSIAVLVVFGKRKRHKLVRATSRGLSNMILLGTLVGSCDVFLFVIQPTTSVCILRRALFHGSVSLLYAPMMIKTTRIYRIFSGGKKGHKKMKFVSNALQMAASITIFGLQVGLL